MVENNENKIGFFFRKSFVQQMKRLKTVEQTVMLANAAIALSEGKEVDIKDDYVDMAFSSWRTILEFDKARQEEYREKMSNRTQKATDARRAKRQQKPKEIEFVEAEEEERFPFSEFWKLYDKDVNESECLFAWKHYSDETKGKIMNHVKAYVCAKRDKRYRKDPLNYLKQQTWLDEIIDTTENTAAYGSNIKKSIREQEFERNVEVLKDTVARAQRGEYAALDPFNAPAKEYWELQRDMENGGAT